MNHASGTAVLREDADIEADDVERMDSRIKWSRMRQFASRVRNPAARGNPWAGIEGIADERDLTVLDGQRLVRSPNYSSPVFLARRPAPVRECTSTTAS
jgi:hypothetical protein